jgi:oxygen-independent coproporphyrinogen III oxidase
VKCLYVHIPFCVKKCSYCDFYSLPARQDTIESYVQAVLREAHTYTPSFVRRDLKGELSILNPSFQTLYIGGGTPSLLGPKHLTTLITGLAKTFDLVNTDLSMIGSSPLRGEEAGEGVPLLEATIEVNPESATPEFLQTAKDLGFNRISYGVQSLSDDELKSVGRIHTAAQAVAAIKLAQNLKFKAISADLIIGLPGQIWTSLRQSLETLVGMGIQHLSVYCLSLEEGTLLANNPPPDLPSDDLQAKLFEETKKYLNLCGYAHYEISNFALKGFECLHNLNYWRGGEYLGLGPAAASHLNGKRFKNYANLDAYLANPTGQVEYVEQLSAKDKAAEEAMLRLRLLEEGLDTDELGRKFGEENVKAIIGRLEEMAREGLLIKEDSRYRLEPSRILTSNPIFARVIADKE